ncbi:hypothetical protein ACLOJK_023783 [Asimina triloba]
MQHFLWPPQIGVRMDLSTHHTLYTDPHIAGSKRRIMEAHGQPKRVYQVWKGSNNLEPAHGYIDISIELFAKYIASKKDDKA